MPRPQNAEAVINLARRGFLIGTTVLGASFGFPRLALAEFDATGQPLARQAPGDVFEPAIWYGIDPQGKVRVNIIRAELGQHVGTAIARILADELDARWEDVDVVYVDSDPKWGVMVTGGSGSIAQSWPIYRQAGAAGRLALIEAAAQRWRVSPRQCTTQAGQVVCGAQTISYGELVRGGIDRKFSAAELKMLPVKPVTALAFIGKPVVDRDIAAKTTGLARFGMDASVPGMVYASPCMPPTRNDSKVVSVDDSQAKAVAGYQRYLVLDDPTHTVPGWVMVIGDTYMAAQRAARQIKVRWDVGPAAKVSEADLIAHARSLIANPDSGTLLDTGNTDTPPVFAKSSNVLTCEYLTHTVLHFQLEPVNALVFRNPQGTWEIHTGNQWQTLILPRLMQALGAKEQDIVMRSYFLGGGFGRRLNGDYIVPAALASRMLGGKPVKMVLTREQDAQFDSARSVSVQQMRMAFGSDGSVQAMEHRASAGWPSVTMQAGSLPKGKNGKPYDSSAIAGADHWYSVGAQRVLTFNNDLADRTYRPGWLRSVGPGWTGWAVESFMDEAAHHLGQDPLAFRLAHLQATGRNAGGPPLAVGGAARQAEALRRAAQAIGWGQPQARGVGLGLASTFGQERAMPTWVGCGVRLHVDEQTGVVTVQSLKLVIDAGTIVDPDGAQAQCQGGALWGLSMALFEGTEIENGKFRDLNLNTYTPLRLVDTPKDIEVQFVDSVLPPTGLGEPAVTVIAPAVANAIYNAVGVRLRSLPMRAADIKQALAARQS